MARKGGNSGLACLFWEQAQLLGSGPDRSLHPSSSSGRGVPAELRHFLLLPKLPGLRGSAWCPGRGRQLLITAPAPEGRGFASLQVRSEVNHPEAGVGWVSGAQGQEAASGLGAAGRD